MQQNCTETLIHNFCSPCKGKPPQKCLHHHDQNYNHKQHKMLIIAVILEKPFIHPLFVLPRSHHHAHNRNHNRPIIAVIAARSFVFSSSAKSSPKLIFSSTFYLLLLYSSPICHIFVISLLHIQPAVHHKPIPLSQYCWKRSFVQKHLLQMGGQVEKS